MGDLPVMLRVSGRLCIIVGGGGVALRRAGSLLEAGARVRVIAPQVSPELAAMKALQIDRRPYHRGDLAGALLVVVATDDPAVNEAVAAEAQAAGVLINRADDPLAGDLTIPAHARHGPITLAVHTGGISAAAAAAIRRELSAALDPKWPELLEIVSPFRKAIQERFADVALRQNLLAQLTDAQAMAIFKQQGPEALRRHCEAVASRSKPSAP